MTERDTSEDAEALDELPSEGDDFDQVKQALFEAALSGNVKAIEVWLARHGRHPAGESLPEGGTPAGMRTSRKTRRARDFWSLAR